MTEYVAPTHYPYVDLPDQSTPVLADDFANPIVEALVDLAGAGGRVPVLEAALAGAAAYTDEQARDAVGTALSIGVHSGGITATPSDGSDRIDLAIPARNVLLPSDLGLIAWTIDPRLANAGQILPSAGVEYFFKIRLDAPATITGVALNITTVGATVANGFVGLRDSTGARVAVSSAITTAWQSTGYVSNAFTGTYSAAAGVYYASILVGSAGTLPTFSRQVQGNTSIVNALTTAAGGFACGQTGSGLTALASSITLSSSTAAGISYHVGLY